MKVLPLNLCRKNRSTHVHRDHNLLNITSETFTCNLITLAMLSCLPWLNASDKQTYSKMCETENDPSFLPYITSVIGVNNSLPFGDLRHMQRYLAIYVTTQMCRRTEEKVVPTVWLPTPKKFRRVLKRVRPSTDTGPTFLWLFLKTARFSRLLRHAEDTEDIFSS